MKIFLPYRGEFGHKIMWHVPTVYGCKEEKVVCCEQGEEALFPNALDHVIVDRHDDNKRREYMRHEEELYNSLKEVLSAKYNNPEFLFPRVGEPHWFVPKPVQTFGISCDIVICPRKRKYGYLKNWKHWHLLFDRISPKYRVFTAGAPDSSEEIGNSIAWKYPRFLDATLEAILSSKVVIATDNGLAFLALLCGKPLILICYDGEKTAPGYPRINFPRYKKTNHLNVDIDTIPNSWNSVDPIIELLLKKYPNDR